MKLVKVILGVIFIFILSFVFVAYYSYIFSRKVTGVVIDVQKVELSNAIVGGMTKGNGSELAFLHSFAIAIKEASGEIVTASSEDRQWAVVKAGQCVEAKFFPYPPWNLEKSGSYHGARLLKLEDCK